MAIASKQNFLFLQGPLSPFYGEIAAHLLSAGHKVLRANFCGNDVFDWPHGNKVDYRGTLANWPEMLVRLLQDHQIDHILLHGDRRPYHKAAIQVARSRNIRVSVTELGYLRPDWMTLEPFGTSTLSHFTIDPTKILGISQSVPDIDSDVVYRDNVWHLIAHEVRYVSANLLAGWRFPNFQSHRSIKQIKVYTGWLKNKVTAAVRARSSGSNTKDSVVSNIGGTDFILAMQLAGDFQLRDHSPFKNRLEALDYIAASFATHAPEDCRLLAKIHPLETDRTGLSKQWKDLAKAHNLGNRLAFTTDSPIRSLCQSAKGFVTINSSAGFEALDVGCPTLSVMPTIFDIDGLTFQGGLDDFWQNTAKPDKALLSALRCALVQTSQVRGTLYSTKGRQAAARACAEKLMDLSHVKSDLIENHPPRLAKANAMGVRYDELS